MSADLNTSDSAMAVSYENNILGEKIDSRYGIAGSILTVFLFQLLNRLVISVGTPKSVPEKDDWKWRNLVISWIHALICSVWDLSCFVLFPEMWEDLIVYANFYIYSMVTFSAGYFVYDFIDMYINNKLFKLWEVTLHHIAVAGMFIYNILVCTSIAYNCIALLAEVNSFFLHSRKLLQMLRVDYQSRFYRITVAANLVTFVVFRGLSLGGILYGMYYWRVRVPIAYYLTLAASMVIMTVMNPILFYRLLKNDFLRSQPKSQVQKSQMVNGFKENGVNNNVKHNKDL